MDSHNLAVLIPIVAIICTLGLPMVIGIIGVLTSHQRKMAELMRSGMTSQSEQAVSHLMSEVQALRAQVSDLQDRLNQVTLALDARPQAPRLPEIEQEVRA